MPAGQFFAQQRVFGEVEQQRARTGGEFRERYRRFAGVDHDVGCPAAGERVGVVGAHVVADVRAGHEIRDVLDRPGVPEEFLEKLAQRGDFAAGRDQRRLGHGVHDDPLRDRPPLAFVGVQQSGRRPAVDLRGELPAEPDRILQAEIEPRPADRGMDVRGIADEQDPPVTEPLGQPRVTAEEPAHEVRPLPLGRTERNVGAEHTSHALP